MRIYLFVLTVLGFSILTSISLQAKNIMFIGDSITHGAANYYTYRCNLLPMLGSDFDSIGSQTTSASGIPSVCPEGLLDHDHEGHSGWTTSQIIVSLPQFLTGKTIDVALIHLGTNDVFYGFQQGLDSDTIAKATATRIQHIAKNLKATNSKMTILIAGIIPTSNPTANQAIMALNKYVAESVNELDAVFVDHYTGFDPATSLVDGLHPNAKGSAEMARRWFNAIGGIKVSEGEINVKWQPIPNALSYYFSTAGSGGEKKSGILNKRSLNLKIMTSPSKYYNFSIFACKGKNSTLCSKVKTAISPIKSK